MVPARCNSSSCSPPTRMVFWQHQPRPSVHVIYLSTTHSPPPSCGSNMSSALCWVPAASRGRPAAVLLPDIITANNSSGNILHELQSLCIEIGFQFLLCGREISLSRMVARKFLRQLPPCENSRGGCGK